MAKKISTQFREDNKIQKIGLSMNFEADGSLKTKTGLYLFRITAAAYDSLSDTENYTTFYVLAKERPTIDDVRDFLLNDKGLEACVTSWDDAFSDWDEFVEIELVRVCF